MAIWSHPGQPTDHGLRETALADLAERQHGVVAFRQLRALGYSKNAVHHRIRTGRLHCLHRGAYAVGHPLLALEGRWMAAVLACGPGAVLSHRAAAELLGLLTSGRVPIDVIAPGRGGRGRAGIDAHTAVHLTAADVTQVDGIPCTSVARTLLDIAAVVMRRMLERACDQAEILRVFDLRAVSAAMARDPHHAGGPALRAVLAEHAVGETFTRGGLEERFLALCRQAGLPAPEVNAWIPFDGGGGGAEVDFLWRSQRLVVETDDHRTHGTRRSFERDRRRDQQLTLAGWRVVRVTWSQLVREPLELVRIVESLLADAR